MNDTLETKEFDRLAAHPALTQPVGKLFYLAAAEHDLGHFLHEALGLIAPAAGREFLAVINGAKGQWRTVAAWGLERAVPSELLSKALDDEEPVARGEW